MNTRKSTPTNEHTTTLSKDVRVLIPATMRRALGFQPGEALTVSLHDHEVRIARRLEAIRDMQKRLARFRDPANPAVDALLRERRKDAERE